jgi:N-methylhydantoinase A/oxoprolinase/acetone carboxylase beta subunit
MAKGTKMIAQNIQIITKGLHGNIPWFSEAINALSKSQETQLDAVIEVDEQIDAQGKVVIPLAEFELNRILRLVFSTKQARITICFANSEINPVHEKALRNLLKTAGYHDVLVSHLHTIHK